MNLVRLRMVGGKGYGSVNGGSWATGSRGTRNVGSISLFTTSGGYSLIHSFRAVYGTSVVIDLVPVVTPGGEACFYDLVGRRHVGISSGSGSLSAVAYRDFL